MLQFFKENWLMLLFLVTVIALYLYSKYKENKYDQTVQYTMDNIGGMFYPLENGQTWLIFKYNKNTQKNKLNFILKNIKQGDELPNQHGYEYVISELLDKEYYDRVRDSNGNLVSKDGPYVVYRVIPKTAMKQSNITVERNSGAVQITTDNSRAYQNISNSDFITKVNKYRDIMVNNGILEEDIDVLLSNSKDDDVKKSFLSKYGVDLAKIAIDVGGKVISLLAYLKG
ncbi:hypothetical protein JZO66_10580 [Enterococcus sp. DIV0242_7C1]|uniref:Uncharacterized protein n=2 Tax=Candidatus Enterococcus dunnyi TaxID=1834192 RepID=A0AAQ3Y1H6_9ENTE|nr:hypothetical protein [Enterococcus sp. DIV0242_7C1]MBO0470991.1 hypothetical protein [Enterococcus sp. DIV0242_7C1]